MQGMGGVRERMQMVQGATAAGAHATARTFRACSITMRKVSSSRTRENFAGSFRITKSRSFSSSLGLSAELAAAAAGACV